MTYSSNAFGQLRYIAENYDPKYTTVVTTV